MRVGGCVDEWSREGEMDGGGEDDGFVDALDWVYIR